MGGAEALSLCPELETEDLAEYIATGDCFAVGLLSHEGMMLHASAVEYGGQAVCFSAPPGHGKIHPHGKMGAPVRRVHSE